MRRIGSVSAMRWRSSSRVRIRSSHSSTARAEAERGPQSMIAISPTISPAPRRAMGSSAPPRVTKISTRPRVMM
jgi:hypothetical protein